MQTSALRSTLPATQTRGRLAAVATARLRSASSSPPGAASRRRADVGVDLVGAAPPVEAAQQAGAVVVVDQRLGLARGRPPGACGSSPRGRPRAGSGASRPGRRRPRAWADRTRRGRCGRGSSRTRAGPPGGGRPPRRAPRSAARRSAGGRARRAPRASASAWLSLRGKPSSRNPSRASASPIRSMIMPTITSSGTSSPASMYRLASMPSSVPSATCARSMSPVEMCGSAEVLAQALGLRALARARRAEQDQVQLRHVLAAYPFGRRSLPHEPALRNRSRARIGWTSNTSR